MPTRDTGRFKRGGCIALVVALTALGCRPPPPCTVKLTRCTAERAPCTGAATLEHGGRTRRFLFHLPPGAADGAARPLVVALHGRLGTGEAMVELTCLDKVADELGFVALFPDGVEKSWNDRREATPAFKLGVDDVGFISTLIDQQSAALPVDKKRVYLTGMSNGGIFCHELGCQLSDKVAAIAPVTGLMPEKTAETCAPSRPVPVMMILGSEDPLVPYDGGTMEKGAGGVVLSAVATAGKWASVNRCAGQPAETAATDAIPDDGTSVTRSTWAQCDGGAEVMTVTIVGGGHAWPGGWEYVGEGFIGKTSKELDASREVWRFFSTHSLP